ncbi:endonuclease III [Methanosphaerula palustris]|uniref:Endonuclease III n=1 Tax=Methanosphaerula palustris (strain ATCC BAA-1556 / DSM 19958 / E1-9c) TaxID=521011 RepID=B8GKX2_METPE|nr:endonuclease III [Methanosphaerula palustris]ACL17268.1 endonuclease III [Methanosphaerula palustris E1-9c]
MDRVTAAWIYDTLAEHYPDACTPLPFFHSPFQVLILTILSAQTTDQAVDKIRPALFARYPTPADLAAADVHEVEKIIHSTGFYRVKARHIISTAAMLVNRFGGTIPSTMEELLLLPGVGRKTANILLFHALGINAGIAVDTHVKRLAGRLGLTTRIEQDLIEQDLMNLYPQERWGDLTDIMIAHGRRCCTAINPHCGVCPVSNVCPFYQQTR